MARTLRPLSPEVLKAMEEYRWPGNVRELENMVKRMVVLGNEQVVLQEIATRATEDGTEMQTDAGAGYGSPQSRSFGRNGLRPEGHLEARRAVPPKSE